MRPRDKHPDIVKKYSNESECPICGERLEIRHCKYICPNHGVVIDCSDPFK